MGKRFRLHFAEFYDGVGADGTPFFDPDRLSITDHVERKRLAECLNGGTVVVAAFGSEPDVLAPHDRPSEVEISYSTDGFFVWRTEMVHFVEQYGLEPDFEFYAHIRRCNYQLATPEPSEELTAEVYEMMAERD